MVPALVWPRNVRPSRPRSSLAAAPPIGTFSNIGRAIKERSRNVRDQLQKIPPAIVMKVSGAPTAKYSQKINPKYLTVSGKKRNRVNARP